MEIVFQPMISHVYNHIHVSMCCM